MSNIFIPIIINRGFSQSASGRFVSPDMKYGDGISVEVVGNDVIARFKGGMTLYEASCPSDIQKFRSEVY